MKPYHVVEILRSLQNGFTFLPTITHARQDRPEHSEKYTMAAKSSSDMPRVQAKTARVASGYARPLSVQSL